MRIIRVFLVLAFLVPALAKAQDVTLTAFGGYNIGGNIDVRENMPFKIKTSDSFATGAAVTWQRTPQYAFELFWGWRPTHVEGRNPMTGKDQQFTTLNAHDFHGDFLFMPAYVDGNVVPFLLLGLGVTYFNPGEVTFQNVSAEPSGTTRFSWAIGGGIKTKMQGRVGVRAQVRFHSSYVSDEYGGTWCDPYYGCYSYVDSNWLDEWDFMGGIVFALGGRR